MPVALSRLLCNRRVPNAVRNFPVNPGSAKRSDGKTPKSPVSVPFGPNPGFPVGVSDVACSINPGSTIACVLDDPF
jgi:hypothetical protein